MHNPRRNCKFIRCFAELASGFDSHAANAIHFYHNESSMPSPPPRTLHDILQPRPVLAEPHLLRLNPHDSNDPILANGPPRMNYQYYEYSPTPPVPTFHPTPSAPRIPHRLPSLTPLTGFSPSVAAFTDVIPSLAPRATEITEGIQTFPFNRLQSRQRRSTPENYFAEPISSNGLQLYFCKSFNQVIQPTQLTGFQPRWMRTPFQKSLQFSPPRMFLPANLVQTKGKARLDQIPSASSAQCDLPLVF